MPLSAIKLIPGVSTQATALLNQMRVSYCNLIRWKDGMVQKLGGWQKFYSLTVGSAIRALHAWQDLNDNDYLGVGAESSLDVVTSGVLTNITPQTSTENFAADFTTTNGDPQVLVGDTASNLSVYDLVYFQTHVSVGGIILYGPYSVSDTGGANAYEVTAAINATATIMNGGAVSEYTTTNGNSLVTVKLEDHAYVEGQTYYAGVSTSVGGTTIFGAYTIQSITDADHFVINASLPATSGATVSENGGLARAVYYYALGPSGAGAGFGLGGFGDGGFGTGAASGSVATGTPITAVDWTLDNWGEIFLACPDAGPIYQWRPGTGFQNAQVIPTAPFQNTGIFVAMPSRILVAFGSSVVPGLHDTLLVRWSDVDDFTNWTPGVDSQAGSFRLATGSRIVGGIQGPRQCLLWTDIGLWSMTYIGYDISNAGGGIFGFSEIAKGCGLVSKNAMAILSGSVFWMTRSQFYALTGNGVTSLPCDVWDAVFQNINTAYLHKVTCAANSMFNEITWYYPSANSTENDSYVKLNVKEGLWDYGTLQRTAWIDQSILGEPIGADASGFIYQHETSMNADGAPLQWFWETGAFLLADGDYNSFVDWFLPDFKFGTYSGSQNAQVLVTIKGIQYPSQTLVSKGPYTVSASSPFFSTRLMFKELFLRCEGGDLNTFTRLGMCRGRIAPAGRR